MNAHSWNIQTADGTCRSFCSCVKQNIWEPTMLAQDCRVNTVRMKGSVSPCRCTMDAIWITGSLSASGKIPVAGWDPDGETLRLLFFGQSYEISLRYGTSQANKSSPFLPAHSMSKLSTRSGAILCHSPSAGWLIKSVQPTSTSYWHKETCGTNAVAERFWTLFCTRKKKLKRSCFTHTHLARIPRVVVAGVLLLTHLVLAFGKFNPTASDHIAVHHKPGDKKWHKEREGEKPCLVLICRQHFFQIHGPLLKHAHTWSQSQY